MTYSLSFWLQMSEPITHIDTDNYMTIRHKGTSYFDSTAHFMATTFIYNLNDKYMSLYNYKQ